MAVSDSSLSTSLWELSRLFLKLGAIGFGGPQAHIAMINDEAVQRRQWFSQDAFSDGLAICEMLPGPASTQMGIYTGYVRAGQLGALVAGLSFIAPAFVIVVGLSWAYFQFQQVPQLSALFFGVSPVMISIILGFCWKLGRKSIKDGVGIAIAIAALLVASVLKLNTLLLFLIAGLLGLWLYGPKRPKNWPAKLLRGAFVPVLLGTAATGNGATSTVAVSGFWGSDRIAAYSWPLLSFFLQVGAFIFGGGLVIIPLLEFEVVQKLGWLSTAEFLNGVAIGQLSPGPVVLTAAFVGYKVAGLLGAAVATVGIFTPSFIFIMAAAPLLLKLRQNPWVQGFLKGVKPAVVGAIAAAAIPLGQSAYGEGSVLTGMIAVGISLVALVALIRFRQPTWLLVLAGAVIGIACSPLLA
ncbi:MAG: chromate efflux transporter [Cyanobacteria bacterium P01_C01_bin.73]